MAHLIEMWAKAKEDRPDDVWFEEGYDDEEADDEEADDEDESDDDDEEDKQ